VSQARLPIQGLFLLLGITLFWGLNWPALKVITGQMPVLWFRTSCLIFGGSAILLLSALSGNRWTVPKHELKPLLICAVFNVCCWHIFSAYGVSLIPAGRAAIIAFTMPLWASILSVWLLRESFSWPKAAGLFLGLTGLALLMGGDISVVQQAPIGTLAMLLAATTWGLGTVLFKARKWQTPVATHIGWQLLFGSVPLLMGALAFQEFPDLGSLDNRAWIALIYIYLGPMTFCQWAYFKVVHLFPASIAAIGTLLVPVVGVFSGGLLLGEVIGWREVSALLLTCTGLAVVLLMGSKPSDG
jgi:drug/metabolite transporter (DMT)-like permease